MGRIIGCITIFRSSAQRGGRTYTNNKFTHHFNYIKSELKKTENLKWIVFIELLEKEKGQIGVITFGTEQPEFTLL